MLNLKKRAIFGLNSKFKTNFEYPAFLLCQARTLRHEFRGILALLKNIWYIAALVIELSCYYGDLAPGGVNITALKRCCETRKVA